MNNYYRITNTFAFIEVSGADAKTYLQGQMSCDINKLEDSHAMLGCCCNLKGRIETIFYLFSHEDSYLLAVPAELIEESIARLKKYAMFSKVTIKEAANDFNVIGINAGKSFNFDLIKNNISISFPLEDRFLLFVFGLTKELEAFSTSLEKPTNYWKNALIQTGIPLLNQASYEKFLPQELNLDKLGALDFDKGCYTGQEVVARLHYRGGLKQHLYVVSVTLIDPITTYTEIHNDKGKLVGHVVNSAPFDNQQMLLVVLRDDSKDNAYIDEQKLLSA